MISGYPYLIERPVSSENQYSLTPRQSRSAFTDCGWQIVVGFHTRNVVHRGHEYVQMNALAKSNADALFVSPVVGKKKPGDFTGKAIVECYNALMQNGRYDPYGVMLGTLTTYSRYSGSREAVFTAICRKNFGCSHFIIGRDHTGVGQYYEPDASQRIFDTVHIGVEIMTFDAAYFCKECKEVTSACSHDDAAVQSLSGTQLRCSLIEGKPIPEYLVCRDVAEVLTNLYDQSPDEVFEKSP